MKQLTDFSDSSFFWISIPLLIIILAGLAFRVYEFYKEWKIEQDAVTRLKRDQLFKILSVVIVEMNHRYSCVNEAYRHEYEGNLWQIITEDLLKDPKLNAYSRKEKLSLIREFRNAYDFGSGKPADSRASIHVAHSNM
ncbi:MAG: hypothetical protein ACHQRM_16320 [Bacteroidia bacterium]